MHRRHVSLVVPASFALLLSGCPDAGTSPSEKETPLSATPAEITSLRAGDSVYISLSGVKPESYMDMFAQGAEPRVHGSGDMRMAYHVVALEVIRPKTPTALQGFWLYGSIPVDYAPEMGVMIQANEVAGARTTFVPVERVTANTSTIYGIWQAPAPTTFGSPQAPRNHELAISFDPNTPQRMMVQGAIVVPVGQQLGVAGNAGNDLTVTRLTNGNIKLNFWMPRYGGGSCACNLEFMPGAGGQYIISGTCRDGSSGAAVGVQFTRLR